MANTRDLKEIAEALRNIAAAIEAVAGGDDLVERQMVLANAQKALFEILDADLETVLVATERKIDG